LELFGSIDVSLSLLCLQTNTHTHTSLRLMALNSLYCADVPLSNYSLTLTHLTHMLDLIAVGQT